MEETSESNCVEQTAVSAPEMQKALEEARRQAEEYLNSWKRAQADYSNLKRQSEQERQETARFCNTQLLLAVLPVMDDLERAIDTVPQELNGSIWIEGIRLIYRKMCSNLETQGLKPIKSLGELFNPHVHEACNFQPGPEGKILGEIQKGYTLNDRLLRPSKVIVGSQETGEKKEE